MTINISTNHKDWNTHQFKGLVDGGQTVLKCKNCEAPLAEVWITNPDKSVSSEIQALCPYCGNKSFKKKFYGNYHLGHTQYSIMTDFKLEGDILTIVTSKGQTEWKK